MRYDKEPTKPPFAALRPYLRDGEELLWSGRPCASKKYRPGLFQLGMGVFLLLFSLGWESAAIAAAIDSWDDVEAVGFRALLFPFFGSFFLCFALYNFWNLLFGMRKKLRQVAYGVTGSRILILYPQRKTILLKEYLPANLPELRLEMHKDGTGTIHFAPPPATQNNNAFEVVGLDDAFLQIDDPKRVYDLIVAHR